MSGWVGEIVVEIVGNETKLTSQMPSWFLGFLGKSIQSAVKKNIPWLCSTLPGKKSSVCTYCTFVKLHYQGSYRYSRPCWLAGLAQLQNQGNSTVIKSEEHNILPHSQYTTVHSNSLFLKQ